jgi:hypothetical protein
VPLCTGRAALAAEWFRRLGFTMPYGVNMADFILDVASGAVVTSKLEAQQANRHLIACSERSAASACSPELPQGLVNNFLSQPGCAGRVLPHSMPFLQQDAMSTTLFKRELEALLLCYDVILHQSGNLYDPKWRDVFSSMPVLQQKDKWPQPAKFFKECFLTPCKYLSVWRSHCSSGTGMRRCILKRTASSSRIRFPKMPLGQCCGMPRG